MDKMLVVVFENAGKAYEGSKALQDLQNEGSVSLYAKAVIVRNADGTVEVKQEVDNGPVGTGVGLMVGSLIGLLGGPVGIAVGAGTGMLGGMMYDLSNAGVGGDFIDEVAQSLQPGKAALVADVWEEWVLPVDTSMEALGGVVFRRVRGEFVDAQINRDVEAASAESAALVAEFHQANDEAKAKLKAKLAAQKAKLQTMQEGIKAKVAANKQATQAKMKSLQEQIAKARGIRKAAKEARMKALLAEEQRRDVLFRQAGELLYEASKTLDI